MTDAARHLVGFEPLDTLAKTVLESEGPSGPNKVSVTAALFPYARPLLIMVISGLSFQACGECTTSISSCKGRLFVQSRGERPLLKLRHMLM